MDRTIKKLVSRRHNMLNLNFHRFYLSGSWKPISHARCAREETIWIELAVTFTNFSNIFFCLFVNFRFKAT